MCVHAQSLPAHDSKSIHKCASVCVCEVVCAVECVCSLGSIRPLALLVVQSDVDYGHEALGVA